MKIKELKYPLEASARTALYFLPAASASVFLGRFKDPVFKKYKNLVPLTKHFKEIKKLYEKDSENIKNNYYLAPQHFLPNLKEYGLLNLKNALDLFRVKDRMQKKDIQVFETKISPEDFPAYFRQNFHYQSGGYLSSESAELYDHQVELVFSGTAEAMRRHAIKAISLARGIKKYPSNEKLKILDIGCGTGHFTAELKRHFPMSEVVGLDLSPWYLKEAEKKFPDSGIEWKFCKAEKLDFEDNAFDVVTSIYLFHELPENIRKQAAKEMLRVLKPGGTLVQMDSLQKGDTPELDPSLEVFPHLYHEPYYENYVSQKSEALFEKVGLKEIETEEAFYSKILRGTKEEAAKDEPRS
ncbi:MAG: class I SAM-dependent methyltransferase [Bdellovibrionota bacterium]